MRIPLNLLLENWQNKGNIFYVYKFILVVVVVENVTRSGMAVNCYYDFHFFLPVVSLFDDSQDKSERDKTMFNSHCQLQLHTSVYIFHLHFVFVFRSAC